MSESNDLLIMCKKGSEMDIIISQMMESEIMQERVVNREIFLNAVGDYRIIYSIDTNLEDVTDILARKCLGYSIR